MIRIRVRLFSILAELSGQKDLEFWSSENASCGEVLSRLGKMMDFPESVLRSCFVAVNGNSVDLKSPVREGDELAILPPVSGGR